jgi:hypothetical protein
MSKTKLLFDVVNDLKKLADSVQAVADALCENETIADKPADVAAPATHAKKEVSLETVRAVLAEKSRNGHTAEVRELLKKHGAEKLSEIDPSEYPVLLSEAEVL